jgi:hypothetical protein
MFSRVLSDGSVWLAFGLACFALFFALEYWAGTSATIDFIRGVLIGMSLAAFAGATVMLAQKAASSTEKTVRKPAPSRKGRR